MIQGLLTRAGALLVVALAGCATPNTVQPGGEKQLLEDIKAGTVQLDCGLACMPVYMFSQSRIQRHLRETDWPGLGLTVAQTSYRLDIAYFYLGMSAEGMKAWAAADRYYRMAGALATGKDPNAKCASVKNLCGGLSFPRDIVTRLRSVSTAMGRAPVTTQELRTAAVEPPRPAAVMDGPIADAPQALLAQYAARRLFGEGTGDPRRDQAFREQLLEVLEPAAAQASAGNEIARPRAIQALTDRLGNQVVEQRLVLGMWVQLRDYDTATQSFELRYPLYSRSRPPVFTNALYGGKSERSAPSRAYSSQGTACVWERGTRTPEYLPADEAGAYFALMLLCGQSLDSRARPDRLDARTAEVPPYAVLQPTPRGLWPRLNVEVGRAEAMVRQMGAGRLAWAELVFDVRAVGALSNGPFVAKAVLEQRAPGMVVAMQPRALVVWQDAPDPRKPGKVLATAGDLPAQAMALQGRVPRSWVPERSYEGQPEPVIADFGLPAGAVPSTPQTGAGGDRGTGRGGRVVSRPTPTVEVSPEMKPVPLPRGDATGGAPATRQTPAPARPAAPPAPTRPAPATPAKPAKDDDGDEDWVEPPPARR